MTMTLSGGGVVGTITAVAGNGEYGDGYFGHDDGKLATQARIVDPYDVAVDAQGNLYIAHTGSARVRKVSAGDGIITTVAGSGEYGESGDDGPATQARFREPNKVTLDAQGNLYIADSDAHVVRKVTFAPAPAPDPAPSPSTKARANLSGVGACNQQKAAAGSVFAHRLTVTAADADTGSPLTGLPVLFTVDGSTGSHFPGNTTTAEVVTDAQGKATAPELTAGPTPGAVTISMEAHHNPGSNPAHYQAEVTPA
ncbi:hypothetical protein [Streptomyces sp. NPDC052042]|uniref:hypothetical protein n=1 Tax=Streptomyces sp. NPDC052042 TaxID=3365683 RepID=UPI0037D5F1F2